MTTKNLENEQSEQISLSYLLAANKRYKEALQEITKGEGAYNTDPLIHASNTIENMIEIAKNALTESS